MQDKNNREPNPALIDNAWLQMEQQLNQAMPQKKRRAIWWWASLAGLAVLLLNIYLFGKGDEQEPLKAKFVPEPATIVADKAYEQQQNNDKQTKSLLNEDQTKVASVAGNPLPSSREAIRSEEQTAIEVFQEASPEEKNKRIENVNNGRENSAPASRAIVEVQSSTVVTTREVPTPENTSSLTTEIPVSVSSKRSEATTLLVNTLPPSISAFLPIPRDPTSSRYLGIQLPVKVTEVKPISPWHYYLEGQGGISLATTDYRNIAVGAGVQRDFGAKWNAELGMQYQLNKRSFFAGENQRNSSFSEDLLGTLGSGYAVERTAAFQNLETARLNLYVGGSYQLSPRISFGVAIQASYFTSAFAVFESSSIAVSQPVENVSNDLRVDFYDSVLSVYDLDTITNAVTGPYTIDTNRWQWSLNSSARYRFAQHWEANLQYQHHLTEWPSKEGSFGGLSALQVGLRYYLR
jgi:hypothetical protein